MKKLIYFSLVGIAFGACNNSNNGQQTSAADTLKIVEVHEHEGHMASDGMDTTAILPNQKVFFANLKDGETIKLPFILKFGVEGMDVKPAMAVEPNTGHHHLAIDKGPVPANTMVPMKGEAEGYFHFGKGQLLDTLRITKYPMLIPGKHTITLQFANSLHMSYGPAMSKTVTVNVK